MVNFFLPTLLEIFATVQQLMSTGQWFIGSSEPPGNQADLPVGLAEPSSSVR